MGDEQVERQKDNFFPMCFAGMGFVGTIIYNMMKGRPNFAGIYKHAAMTGTGYFIGLEAEKLYYNKQRERLMVIQDYMQQHPDDFVEPDRKKFKDVFIPWTPTR